MTSPIASRQPSAASRPCAPLATLIALLAAALPAQEPPAAGPDHDALRALKTVYERAVSENRLELLEPHLDPEFTGVMLTGEIVRGIEDARRYWTKIRGLIGEGGRYTAALKPETSTILGDVALAKGTTEDVVITGGGTEYRFEAAWTAVCRKSGGEWKLLRLQGTMDPIRNVFALAAVKASAYGAGAIAGPGGFILGIVIALIIKRRRAS